MTKDKDRSRHMNCVIGRLSYDDLKASPLAKADIEPEECAVWLDLRLLDNARGIACLLDVVSNSMQSSNDIVSTSARIVNAASPTAMCIERMSEVILRNLFKTLFKAKSMQDSCEIKELLKHAKNKIKTLKNACQKKLKSRDMNTFMPMARMLEAYEELHERLHDLIEELEKHSNEHEETEDGEH